MALHMLRIDPCRRRRLNVTVPPRSGRVGRLVADPYRLSSQSDWPHRTGPAPLKRIGSLAQGRGVLRRSRTNHERKRIAGPTAAVTESRDAKSDPTIPRACGWRVGGTTGAAQGLDAEASAWMVQSRAVGECPPVRANPPGGSAGFLFKRRIKHLCTDAAARLSSDMAARRMQPNLPNRRTNISRERIGLRVPGRKLSSPGVRCHLPSDARLGNGEAVTIFGDRRRD